MELVKRRLNPLFELKNEKTGGTGQQTGMIPDQFPQAPLDSVPYDGGAGRAGHDYAGPHGTLGYRIKIQVHVLGAQTDAFLKNETEVLFSLKPAHPRKRERLQTAILFLPLDRRRDKTARPLLVFILDRNPCTFLRFRLLG